MEKHDLIHETAVNNGLLQAAPPVLGRVPRKVGVKGYRDALGAGSFPNTGRRPGGGLWKGVFPLNPASPKTARHLPVVTQAGDAPSSGPLSLAQHTRSTKGKLAS